jgi:tRNA threonylcarbamoyladenosine biosynthesis protein TsaE
MSVIKQLKSGYDSPSAEATEHVAGELAPHIPENTILALHGDLGSGKTTFIRGLARAWGIVEPVTSPTFNLYSIYEGQRQLIHLDAYRLTSAEDLDALMIQDFMRSPWCFAVEWPEHIDDAITADAWHLYLSITKDNKHHIRLESKMDI